MTTHSDAAVLDDQVENAGPPNAKGQYVTSPTTQPAQPSSGLPPAMVDELPLDVDHPQPPTTPSAPDPSPGPESGAGQGAGQGTGRSLASATVVARAQDGDVAAFSELVRSYQAELLRLAYRMLSDRGEAQDVVQDALMLAWRKLPTLSDPQAFHAWIYHLTTRQCLNILRARTRRRTDLTTSGDLESDSQSRFGTVAAGDSPADAAESSSRQTALNQVLATIPPDQRACWVLHELHELSYPEISYAIGVPVSTVRGRIARARQQLAKGMTSWR